MERGLQRHAYAATRPSAEPFSADEPSAIQAREDDLGDGGYLYDEVVAAQGGSTFVAP